MKYPDRNRGKQGLEVPDEPYSRLCCDHDRDGNRCAEFGALSESTHGSDRWYCHKHFPLFRGLYA